MNFKATFLLSLLILCSCNNYDDSLLYAQIEELETELYQQKKIIESIANGATITSIVEADSSYTIIFSNGDSITLSNGMTPIITIGNNGDWYINGKDTGKSSKGENGSNGVDGQDGEDGKTPTVSIGENGYWYINGENTGVKAEGTDGSSSPYIVSIIDNGIEFVFNFSDGSSINSAKLTSNYYGSLGNITGIGTMGASLIFDGNNWVESACHALGVKCYNKAVSGLGCPEYFSEKLWRKEYCTDEEFENIDILAIQFASSKDVYQDNIGFLNSYEDYSSVFDYSYQGNPFYKYTTAQNIDYILKYWQNWCYIQKDNINSKWYGTQHGKPCRLIFITHWHDARTSYNESIRKLAQKWGGCNM